MRGLFSGADLQEAVALVLEANRSLAEELVKGKRSSGRTFRI
jgi:hypothetical protein